MQQDEMLTPDAIEAWLHIKKGTQAALRSRRQIPFLRLGKRGCIRYSRAAIEAWLVERSVDMSTPAPYGLSGK